MKKLVKNTIISLLLIFIMFSITSCMFFFKSLTSSDIVNDKTIENGNIHEILSPIYDYSDGSSKIAYDNSMAIFTKQQRNIYALDIYIYEVGNGGHTQYYYNSSRMSYEDAVAGLELLELYDVFDILMKSKERLPDEYNVDTRLEDYEEHIN